MLFSDDPELINEFIGAQDGGWEQPGSFTALGSLVDGNLVGGITWSRYNGAHALCNIALLSGHNHRSLLVSGLHYSFAQLGLRRLTFMVKGSNIPSQTFVRRLGASLEATLQGADPSGDLLIFALWPGNCPLWMLNYGKKLRESAERA